jgi:hypothetical protein
LEIKRSKLDREYNEKTIVDIISELEDEIKNLKNAASMSMYVNIKKYYQKEISIKEDELRYLKSLINLTV